MDGGVQLDTLHSHFIFSPSMLSYRIRGDKGETVSGRLEGLGIVFYENSRSDVLQSPAG